MPVPQTIPAPEWIPLANYAGANHVLGAGIACVHPANGNQYFWDCVQWDGPRQDLNIYRLVAKTGAWEHVVTFEGVKDAERGFERGQCWIGQGGALIIATTMTPKGVPYVTKTGFQGVRCRIPNIDSPWGDVGLLGVIEQRLTKLETSLSHDPRVDALISQFAALTKRVDAIEEQLRNLSSSAGLSPQEKDALRRLVDFLEG